MEEMERIGNGEDLNSLYPNIREFKKRGYYVIKSIVRFYE
jgi:hypothetical protein